MSVFLRKDCRGLRIRDNAMPRNERVLSVFVASPSDLDPERNTLEEIIDELNRTWTRSIGIRLELIRWESYAYPAIGEDAQEVINRQIPKDYDIFVGMMWGRYGTPSERAGSGTEEEFRAALARYQGDPLAVRIMFYFKNEPIPPASIDPIELQKIHEFRVSLGDEGALYWLFDSREAFESLIRIHLSRQIQDFAKTANQSQPQHIAQAAQPRTHDDDDLGLLDIMDLVEEHFRNLTEISKRIGKELSELGIRIRQRTDEINAAVKQSGGRLERRDARSLIERAAIDMSYFADRVRGDIPLFRDTLAKGSAMISRAALMAVEGGPDVREQINDAKALLGEIDRGLESACESICKFQNTVHQVPRITANLNKSKRETERVLNEIHRAMTEGRRLIGETLKALDGLLST